MEKLKNTIDKIKPTDKSLLQPTQSRLDNLTKPRGSLGKLEDFAKKIVSITGKENPDLSEKVIITMAGDHGVTQEGVSAYPQEVTAQMVYNFLNGGAGINVLSRHVGADVVVVDMGVAGEFEYHQNLVIKKVARGTKNFAKGPSMTREQAVESIEAGIEVVEELINHRPKKLHILGTGEMGIGNTTPSSAITAVFTGLTVSDVTGRGTGIDDNAYLNKVKVIEKAISINKPDPSDPIDVLSKVGGFEIGGLAGVTLAAAANSIPVVIDGFISSAAALIAVEIKPEVKEYIFAAHKSVEIGHTAILNRIEVQPILDMQMCLGEGTGAVLAMDLIEAGVKILNEMASFGEAGVSKSVKGDA
ncbi:nicotinate-nucleotide--dimethylbenzimidazole phosphoribosyltransferase [Candidatus Poribacteria bacterium]|nr:nicotinate-nucleotide--dimethylbenzimidazole phosphoribosyltransferase [Candidatus Poribacteria bacterium]